MKLYLTIVYFLMIFNCEYQGEEDINYQEHYLNNIEIYFQNNESGNISVDEAVSLILAVYSEMPVEEVKQIQNQTKDPEFDKSNLEPMEENIILLQDKARELITEKLQLQQLTKDHVKDIIKNDMIINYIQEEIQKDEEVFNVGKDEDINDEEFEEKYKKMEEQLKETDIDFDEDL